MSSFSERECPGCGLRMPVTDHATYDGYFNTSQECWSVFTEVIGEEFSNAFLFGRVHQFTVDSYAVQHAGGIHPDKSVAVHLSGLYLSMVREVRPTDIAPILQKLATHTSEWPHFAPPSQKSSLTIFDVAMAGSTEDHIRIVREWARSVWDLWTPHHSTIAEFLRVSVPQW